MPPYMSYLFNDLRQLGLYKPSQFLTGMRKEILCVWFPFVAQRGGSRVYSTGLFSPIQLHSAMKGSLSARKIGGKTARSAQVLLNDKRLSGVKSEQQRLAVLRRC